jgi:DHA1 family tetracycline resistance protein-like MFS transporter
MRWRRDPSPAASLGPVLLTVMLDLLGFGLVIPLLSFYAEDFGASPLQVTSLMASYSVAQFLCAPGWGALSDRIGRRPVMLASIGLAAVFLALFAAASELWMLFVLRFLHGACAANIGTAQAVVADLTPPEQRARGMGMIGASLGLGMTLGPFLGGMLAEYGVSAPIWLAAGLSALNFVWAFFALPETRRPGEAPQLPRRTLDPARILATLRHPAVGMAVGLTFVATFAFSLLESTFALTAEHEWSMDARGVGMMLGMIGVVGIIIQGGLIGRLTRRFGEARLLNIGYVGISVGMAVLALVATRAWPTQVGAPGPGIVAGCLFVAAGFSLANPSLSSLVSRGAEAEERGSVLGVNQSLAALARATAPATGGVLFEAWYPGAAFAAGSGIMALALVLSIPAARRAVADKTLLEGSSP